MRARVVIGANFGDEGKGLVTDWLCASNGADVVVRFNGGAQAGHTVVTPEGERHIFSHFGSGTFCNVPTFLSSFFICNPILFLQEYKMLFLMGEVPRVFAHPTCRVTTFADMWINQILEKQRGDKRHGSCGLGIAETADRSLVPGLSITVADLWNGVRLEDKLREICTTYSKFRTGEAIPKPDGMIHEFISRCRTFASLVHPLGMGDCKDPIFEGAQGLLLDQCNKEFFPHVTRSNTGMTNVRVLCAQAGINDIQIHYVSRTYLTRHGAGRLPGEDTNLTYDDLTNLDHPFQGKLRFAPLDSGLVQRVVADAGANKWSLFFTHLDQRSVPSIGDGVAFSGFAHGPTRNDVSDWE